MAYQSFVQDLMLPLMLSQYQRSSSKLIVMRIHSPRKRLVSPTSMNMAEDYLLQEVFQAPRILSEMRRRREAGLIWQLGPYETPPMLQLTGEGPQPACGEESSEKATQARQAQLVVSIDDGRLWVEL